MPVTVLRTNGGFLDAGDRQALAALKGRLGQGEPKVLIYLHGGLVDQASGERSAQLLSGRGAGSFDAPPEWEQVYVIWKTGVLEVLRQRWTDLFHNDRLYRALLKQLISFASRAIAAPDRPGRSIGGRGLTVAEVEARLAAGGDSPFADQDEVGSGGTARAAMVIQDDVENDLRTNLELDSDISGAAEDIEAHLAEGAPATARRASLLGDPARGAAIAGRLDGGLREAPPGEGGARQARFFLTSGVLKTLVDRGVKIGWRVVNRYRSGRDHGLHATVVEEIVRELYVDLIGSVVWDMMRDDARDHFAEGALGDSLLGVLEGNPARRLVVVGHSAGAIWASEMLLAAARRPLPCPMDLVLLAPAARMRKFAEALDAGGQAIGWFRLFAMQDINERRDPVLGRGLGAIYPSSLLYLVSGLFEGDDGEGLADAPLLGLQRFLQPELPWLTGEAEIAAAATVRRFLAQQPGRSVFSVAEGAPGLACGAVSHGSFHEDGPTLAGVATFLT